MIDYLFEIVEPNGYCLNGYPKKELLEQFKKNTIASKEEPTTNHLYQENDDDIKCWSILEAQRDDYYPDDSFIFMIDYSKGCSIEELSPTTMAWLLHTDKNITLKLISKENEPMEMEELNDLEKDFYDKILKKKKIIKE